MNLTEWLAEDSKLSGAEVFTSALTIIAGMTWVYLDGFTGETIAQVIATLGTASIIIITFIHRIKQNQHITFDSSGKSALVRLKNYCPNILNGPKYSNRNKESFSIDTITTDERQYLFFQKTQQGQESQFIPVMPFKQAIIAIYIGSWALRVAGSKSSPPTFSEIEDVKSNIKTAVKAFAEKNFKGLFDEIAFDATKSGNENLCIVLDFYDDKISPKKFESAVYEIGKVTIELLTEC